MLCLEYVIRLFWNILVGGNGEKDSVRVELH